MTRNFQSWEKDPFFFAAEQVQDSADRLESAYRAWIHAKSLSWDVQDNSTIEFCRRELSTALGIAKWQLEEFEKEVLTLSSETQQPHQQHAEDDTHERHGHFIDAISNQLFCINNALVCSKDERDMKVLPTVSLRKKENDELANFLCGSRISTGDDVKEVSGSWTRPDKGNQEVAILRQSASLLASSSGLDYGKALFGSLEEGSSPVETHKPVDTYEPFLPYETCISENPIVNRPESHGAMVKDTVFICINVDQRDEGTTCASGLGDCYDNVGTCIERPNGHHRSTSLGGWKDGPSTSDYKTSHKQVTNNSPSKIWPFLSKSNLIFQSGGSQDGLKRWKDGEGDAIDLCGMSDSDMEANCSIFVCQDGKRYKGCSEALLTFQSSQKAASIRRLIQATSAILAALGLLGLYCH